MQNIDKNRPAGLARAAKDSAILVAVIAIGMAAIAAVVAICFASMLLAITKWQDIAWAITLGGNFWGGIMLSILVLFAGAWAFETAVPLDEDNYSRVIVWLKIGGCLGIGLSALAQFSLVWLWISGEFGKLTNAQVLALAFPISCSVMYLLYNAYAASFERA